MNIVYLTVSLLEEDFLACYQGKHKPNPSNQNFHHKLISALSLKADVDVFTLMPKGYESNPGKVKEVNEKLRYHYLTPCPTRWKKFLFQQHRMNAKLKELGNKKIDYVIYDSMNYFLAKTSKIFAKRLHAKRIAVLTDNPLNITGASSFYAKMTFKASAKPDGYFTLTEGLNDLWNPTKKPHLTHMGVVEKVPELPRPRKTPYFYLGGALYVRYGIQDLIDAYLALKPDYDLVLSGHGDMEEQLAELSNNTARIFFLGQISKEDNYAYEQNASLNFNPRHFDEDLNKTSVPSKVLEYLSFSAPIASTPTTPIEKEFSSSINWIEGDLTSFLKEHLDEEGHLTGLKENNAAEALFAHYGLEATGEAFTSFLASLSGR